MKTIASTEQHTKRQPVEQLKATVFAGQPK
jgi:hypothetical protein